MDYIERQINEKLENNLLPQLSLIAGMHTSNGQSSQTIAFAQMDELTMNVQLFSEKVKLEPKKFLLNGMESDTRDIDLLNNEGSSAFHKQIITDALSCINFHSTKIGRRVSDSGDYRKIALKIIETIDCEIEAMAMENIFPPNKIIINSELLNRLPFDAFAPEMTFTASEEFLKHQSILNPLQVAGAFKREETIVSEAKIAAREMMMNFLSAYQKHSSGENDIIKTINKYQLELIVTPFLDLNTVLLGYVDSNLSSPYHSLIIVYDTDKDGNCRIIQDHKMVPFVLQGQHLCKLGHVEAKIEVLANDIKNSWRSIRFD